MHSLYKFLKRNSKLFVRRYGKANRIKESNSKVISIKKNNFALVLVQ